MEIHRLLCLSALLALSLAVSLPAGAALRQDSLLVVADSITLRELTVTALQPVAMRGDTLVYDVRAFPLPEGSRLRELLRRLPGVEVTADGIVRAQGTTIDCLLLNGRDFFAGNSAVVLDNLPADVLVDVRVYERVQEDEEDTGMRARTERVMDLTSESDKSRGWFTDFTAAGGYDKRYSVNASASHFDEVWQNMVTVSADNLPQVFGVGDSFYEKVDRTLQEGDSKHNNVSIVFGRKKGVWETTGSAYYAGARKNTASERLSESLLSERHLFSRSSSASEERSHNLTASFHIERHDSMTTFTLDPQMSWSNGRGESNYTLASSTRALTDVLEWAETTTSPYLLNRQKSRSESNYRIWNLSLNSHLRRRLSRKGRTLTALASVELNDLLTYQSTLSSIEYFRKPSFENQLRYSDSPDRQWQALVRMAWIEPLAPWLKLKAEYGVSYRHEQMQQPVYADSILSPRLSKDATYSYLTQSARLLLQWSPSERFFLSVGGQYNPIRSYTLDKRSWMNIDTLRTVYNWAPEFNLYYRSEQGWNVTLKYAGMNRQPSLLDLLPVVDDSDPLQLRRGNPALKPAFVHQLSGTLFWFDPKSQTQINVQLQGQWEYNAITEVVSIDPLLGVRRTSVDNVNGCRQFGGTWTLSTDFVPNSLWTLDLQGDLNFFRRVGLPTFTTHQALLRQYLSLQWHPGVVSVKPYGFFSYNGLRSSQIGVQPSDLWLLGVGVIGRVETSHGWSFAIDASRQSRRGYVDAVDNDDEWLIDLELAYSFLRGRAAELRLQACDLLRQHNLSRSFTSATERVEATYPHSITDYILLSFTYRFSLMGK